MFVPTPLTFITVISLLVYPRIWWPKTRLILSSNLGGFLQGLLPSIRAELFYASDLAPDDDLELDFKEPQFHPRQLL